MFGGCGYGVFGGDEELVGVPVLGEISDENGGLEGYINKCLLDHEYCLETDVDELVQQGPRLLLLHIRTQRSDLTNQTVCPFEAHRIKLLSQDKPDAPTERVQHKIQLASDSSS